MPTLKNDMVKEFYGRFGFERGAGGPEGASEWRLKTEQYSPEKVFIDVEVESSAATALGA
jgi:hypothetical protein